MRFVTETAWTGHISCYFPTPRSPLTGFENTSLEQTFVVEVIQRRYWFSLKQKRQLCVLRSSAGESSTYFDGVDFAFLFGFEWWDRRQRLLVIPSSTDVDPFGHHWARIVARRSWFRLWSVLPYDFVDRGSARWPWRDHVWRCRCGPRSSEGHQQ